MAKYILVVFDDRSVVPNSALLFDTLEEAKAYCKKELVTDDEGLTFDQFENGPIVFGYKMEDEELASEYLAAIYEA